MVYDEQFWLDKYWSKFAGDTWGLFKISVELLGLISGEEEVSRYVNLSAQLSKHIVEKLSRYVEVEEPPAPGVKDAYLIVEFMKKISEFVIGKNPVVTLTWIFKNITFEYARVNFVSIAEKPERFDYLAKILELEEKYTPPEILTGREIDLTFYHAKGYLDHVELSGLVEHFGKGRFRYAILITDKPDFEKDSLASLIIRLGLLSWELLKSKPGILSIFDTIDAKAQFLEMAQSKIPSKAREIVDSKPIRVIGDGKIFSLAEEKVGPDGSIVFKLTSDQYGVTVPMPKACRDALYEYRGALVNVYEICVETDILLRETKCSFSEQPARKLNVIEYMRGIQPFVYLGLWDIIFQGDKHLLITRI